MVDVPHVQNTVNVPLVGSRCVQQILKQTTFKDNKHFFVSLNTFQVNEVLQTVFKKENITLLASNSFVDNPDNVIKDLKVRGIVSYIVVNIYTTQELKEQLA